MDASVERLATHGWWSCPPLEAEEWRRRVKAAARQRGWRLATGTRSTGYPWAARTDLEDASGAHRVSTWGLSPLSFFEMYPPDP